MTEDQGKEGSHSDRLEEIKKEEKEDASSYYAQGESKDNVNEEAELSKPVEDIDPQKEEMNMLKAVAFLGFGMAALAIIFILFFVRDLDTRVVDVDGAVTSLEEKMAPLKQHVDDSIEKINQDIAGLDGKIGNYERIMAVMELKRALVTVQEMSMGNSSKVKVKSDEVVAGIEALLKELSGGTGVQKLPAGTVSIIEAPVAPSVFAEEPAPVEELAPVEESTPVEESSTVEESTPVEEPASLEGPVVKEESVPELVSEASVGEDIESSQTKEAPAEEGGGDEEDDEDEEEDEDE